MENNLEDIITLKVELETVTRELINIKEQIIELNQKQSENIEQNVRDIHNLYDRIAELNTKIELLKQRVDSAENNIKNLHISNRDLMVKNEIMQAKLEDLERRTVEDHISIEKIKERKEDATQSSNTSRTNFLYAICSGIIVAVVMLLINMAL